MQWSRPHLDGLFFKQISSQHAEILEREFSKEEIKEALFRLGTDKSPGPDGFPYLFPAF